MLIIETWQVQVSVIATSNTALKSSISVLCSAAHSCPTLRPHGLQPISLLCPWDFPGKNTGVLAISSSRGSSQPRDRPCITYVSCTGRQVLCHLHRLGSPRCVSLASSLMTLDPAFCGCLSGSLCRRCFSLSQRPVPSGCPLRSVCRAPVRRPSCRPSNCESKLVPTPCPELK